jgi:hypothetical protein
MTYAVPVERCHGWRKVYPDESPGEIARRDAHPYGKRTVRKHIHGHCNHPAPSVDYGKCRKWLKWYPRKGTDEERRWATPEGIRRRTAVLDTDRIEKHLDLECEHADHLGFPPQLPRGYSLEAVTVLRKEIGRNEAVSLSEAETILQEQGYNRGTTSGYSVRNGH